MFICDICRKSAPQGTRCHKVTTKQQQYEFPVRPHANRVKKEDGKWEDSPDFGGIGLQIAREIKVCSKCYVDYDPLINQPKIDKNVKVLAVKKDRYTEDREEDERRNRRRDRYRDDD